VTRGEVIEVLREGAPVCICAHTSPDGDALGSLLGLGLSLEATGRDVVLYQDGDDPFPRELAFLQLDAIQRRVPADAPSRTLIALDCGSALRIDRRGEVAGQFARVVNIDHHHDNTLFGTINLVDAEASCTAEIVAGLLQEAGIPLAEGAALALYVGLVTDTGRFQYVNTTPAAHRLAAQLLKQGVQPAQVFSTLFESLPLSRQRLLGLALGRAQVAAGGRLAATALARDDFEATGADDASSDGVVDALRAIEGVELAALVREPRDRSGPARKVSLRSRAGGVDCSAIARERGGGGHAGAAGFSTDESVEEIVAFLEEALEA
jgi:phosphoesterase RecJ-like protein